MTTPNTPAHHRNIVVLSHNVSQDVADGFFDTNLLLHGRVDVLVRCANAAFWLSNNIRKDCSVFLMLFPQNITIEIQGWMVENLNPDERTMALYFQRTLMVANAHLGERYAGDGDSFVKESAAENSEQPLSVELSHSEETNRPRPETINPVERQRRSVARKQREKLMRRIKKATKYNAGAPVGFVLHQNDSLSARLEQFSAKGPVIMLNETGEPLSKVLDDHDRTDTTKDTTRTTTLIFGDQIGYAESDEKVLAESGVRKVTLGPRSLLTSQCITISHNILDCKYDTDV
jgi:tRNA pseudouridine-54 N-methylase